jgi:hypothetical protein
VLAAALSLDPELTVPDEDIGGPPKDAAEALVMFAFACRRRFSGNRSGASARGIDDTAEPPNPPLQSNDRVGRR